MATDGLIIAMAKAKLAELNVTDADPVYKAWLLNVKSHANEQFFAQVFIRQAGDKFDACRRELQNDFAKGTNHLPKTVDEAYMHYYKTTTTSSGVPNVTAIIEAITGESKVRGAKTRRLTHFFNSLPFS